MHRHLHSGTGHSACLANHNRAWSRCNTCSQLKQKVGNFAASLTSASELASGLSDLGTPTTSRQTTHRGRCRPQLGQLTPALMLVDMRGFRCWFPCRCGSTPSRRARLVSASQKTQRSAICREGGLMAGRPPRLLRFVLSTSNFVRSRKALCRWRYAR